MRNIFLFIIIILECVRFRIGTTIALHQPDAFQLILYYMGQWLPLYAGLALQLAFAVGIMLAFGRLSSNRELDALHALGIGLHHLLLPLVMVASLVAAADFVNLAWLQPLSLYQAKTFVAQIEHRAVLSPAGGDLFLSNGKKTVLLDGIEPGDNRFQRVFLYENYGDGTTMAKSGTTGRILVNQITGQQSYTVDEMTSMQIVLNGREAKVLPVTYGTSSSRQLQGPVNAFENGNYRDRGISEYEWTLPELLSVENISGVYLSDSQRWSEINYRLAQVFFILLAPMIALLAVVEPKRNPAPWRYLAGLLVILGFNQFLGIAASFSRTGWLSPLLTIWLPLLILSAVVIYRFWHLSTRPAFQSAR